MSWKCLNFGAGVNSTALAIEMVNRGKRPDVVVFADTGSELPKTYEHIETMKVWFKENELDFIIVKSKYNCSVYDYYYNKKTIPWRKFRDCTDKFKKTPITKYLKQFKESGIVQLIGISYEERRRVRESKTKWIEFEYPLVNWKIDRKNCVEIIEDAGIKVPVKSGCFMCPYQPKESWLRLLKTHPKLYQKSRDMEEQNRSYPKNTLTWNYNLKQYEKAEKEQKKLPSFVDSCFDEAKKRQYKCNVGWCMT